MRVFSMLWESTKATRLLFIWGGIYHDKRESLKRFIASCRDLDPRIKARLVIENEARC